MPGWQGRVLRVDLGTGSVTEEPLAEELASNFLGGRGLGVYWLFREALAVDPLGPDNIIVLATGPLTGTRAPTAGRVTAVSRSPLTGTVCDSSAGGAFGARLKRCGYDAVIIRGRAAAPVYLRLAPGKAVLEEAGSLWGQDLPTTCRRLRPVAGRNGSILAIGPAGEQGVLFAGAAVDGRRHLGRGGLGAVMGAKRLKAVVVTGDRQEPVSLADRQAFELVLYEVNKLLEASPITAQALPLFGTAVLVNLLNQARSFPTRNFQAGYFPQAEAISGERLRQVFLRGRSACYACPIGCGRVVDLDGEKVEGPEYESIWALGANLGLSDLETIIRANLLCNRYGLDTISTGGTLACAMELAERGLGPDLFSFGSGEAVLRAIPQIAWRQGLGEELAGGARQFARRYGAPGLAMQVKGLELPAYDPRGMQGQGLAFATSNRGGCHLRANMLGPEILGAPKMVNRLESAGKAGLVIYLQHSHAVLDSLVLCKFTAFALRDEHYARLLRAATGQDWRAQDLQRVGERIWNLERLYNLKCGFGPQDDTLPPRFFEEPAQGRPVDLPAMLKEYYRFRRWEADGWPSQAKLAELGLRELLLTAGEN